MGWLFTETHDMGLVKSILCHEKVYPAISDDSAPEPKDYRPNPDLYYLVAHSQGGHLMGCYAFLQGADSWEVHTCLLPSSYGKAAVISRAMLRWLWKNTPCSKVRTMVPIHNRLALALAKGCEMKEYERRPAAVMMGGEARDVIYLEIERPCL